MWLQELCPPVPDKGHDFHKMGVESQATGNRNSILAREEVKQRAEVSALALARPPSHASPPRSLAPLHIFPAFVTAAGPFVCV